MANPKADIAVTSFNLDSEVLPLFLAKKVSELDDINFKPSLLLFCIKTETITTAEKISCNTIKKLCNISTSSVSF